MQGYEQTEITDYETNETQPKKNLSASQIFPGLIEGGKQLELERGEE